MAPFFCRSTDLSIIFHSIGDSYLFFSLHFELRVTNEFISLRLLSRWNSLKCWALLKGILTQPILY